MRVLVTGGAGYIGSVTAERLLEAGHEVTVLDSLVTGHSDSVFPGAHLVVASVLEQARLDEVLRERRVEAVVHCAARSLVGQSMEDPGLYYRENVVGGLALLEALRATGIDRLVFSSTAAVYGEPEKVPVRENAPTRPVSPYGASKLAFESAMHWYAAYGLRSVTLRYFNVAGASARLGERHDPETHLVPSVLGAAAGGRPLVIHGDDYPTADGTAIRDYIHVLDLADAHLAALELTARMAPGAEVCNLGTGSGYSVNQVLEVARGVVGRPIPHQYGPRRRGDPPVLVASGDYAARLLDWHPRRSSLEEMIGSAWQVLQADGAG